MSLDFDVCIITHSYRPLVLNAVLSVLNQSLLPKKLFIIQNNPTIDSYFLHKKIISISTNCNIEIYNINNSTLGEARNIAFKKANSDYLAILDDDDIWKKNRLANIELFLNKNPQIDVLATNFFTFDKNGLESSEAGLSKYDQKWTLNEALFISNYFSGGSSAIISKRVYSNNFFSTQRAGEDWEFWLRLSINGYKLKILYDDYSLGIYKAENTYGQNHSRDLQSTYSIIEKYKSYIKNKEVLSISVAKHTLRALDHNEIILALKILFLNPKYSTFIQSLKFYSHKKIIINKNIIKYFAGYKINFININYKYLNYLKKDNIINIFKKIKNKL